jgi:hypothetical protein
MRLSRLSLRTMTLKPAYADGSHRWIYADEFTPIDLRATGITPMDPPAEVIHAEDTPR